MNKPYSVLVADPPWKFADNIQGKGRGAAKHYNCLTTEEIIQFGLPIGLPPLAADALLFLWRVSALQDDALRVVAAWGFELKAELVWAKKTVKGNDHFGMGHYVRGAHETCLIAVRGRPKIVSHSVRSLFCAPVGRHSEKPAMFFSIVQQMSAGPYLELFARQQRPGWTCLGHEAMPATPPRFAARPASNNQHQGGRRARA